MDRLVDPAHHHVFRLIEEEYELTVTVPAAAQSGPISVRSGGTEARGDVDLQVAGDQAPVIAQFSPQVVAPGERVTIRGERFTGDASAEALTGGGNS